MIANLTDEQIQNRLAILEQMLTRERHTTSLASLNRTYQMLIDELVRRDQMAQREDQT